MRGRTNRALLISFGIHVGLMLAISPFLVSHFNMEKESISAEILEPEFSKRTRRRVLPLHMPLVPRGINNEASTNSPAALIYAPQVHVPKASTHIDVVPDVVTHVDIQQADTPGLVFNTSFGSDKTFAAPVVGQLVIKRQLKKQHGGVSGHAGLGLFRTDVMTGHGLIGQVYVPGGAIFQMPDFEGLTPVYTFVTPNLNVRRRSYTQGFPTPEMQSVIEHFAIRFQAKLKIDTPGIYIFELFSDDGSQLYIDRTLVVDNDGVHSTLGKQGSIKLDTGEHDVEIRYFQGPRHEVALQWFYQPPNAHKQLVPPEVIYHPGDSHIPDVLKKLQQWLEQIEEIE